MSVFAFACAAQFAAVGFVKAGLAWIGIVVLIPASRTRSS
jgi:predicted branched-subunit amino acid permease